MQDFKEQAMRAFHSAILLILLPFAAVQPIDGSEAEPSKEPLTEEEIAVYHTILENLKPRWAERGGHLANQTKLFDRRIDDYECAKGLVFEDHNSGRVIHLLDTAVISDLSLVLVDPDSHIGELEKNCPSMDGVFSLSEIVFDQQHRNAVVIYDYVCGPMCGLGSMVILRKAGKEWGISRRCAMWTY